MSAILRKRQDANKHLCKLSSISFLFLARLLSASITSPKFVALLSSYLLNTIPDTKQGNFNVNIILAKIYFTALSFFFMYFKFRNSLLFMRSIIHIPLCLQISVKTVFLRNCSLLFKFIAL